MFTQDDLLALANMKMPFGKYGGKVLMDLPEEYLLWFQKKGMPEGRLGMLMAGGLSCITKSDSWTA